MISYQHTQSGTLMRIVLGITAVAFFAATFLFPAIRFAALFGVVISLVLLGLFSTLTVKVDSSKVNLSFGPGLIKKSIALNKICSARVVTNRWYWGWGIRLTPHGWLFNVSGFDAVELEFSSGRKFRIGTDDPEGLAQAIQKACGT